MFEKFVSQLPQTNTREKESKIEKALQDNKVYVSYSTTKDAFFIYTNKDNTKEKIQRHNNKDIVKYLQDNKALCVFSEKAQEKLL